jgi:hypothetical protein
LQSWVGAIVGAADGAAVGLPVVGAALGVAVGAAVGAVGETVGATVGFAEGLAVGAIVGAVGGGEGADVGTRVGDAVGDCVQYCGHRPGQAMPNPPEQSTLNTTQRGSSATPLQKVLVGAEVGAAVGAVGACLRARARALSMCCCWLAVSTNVAPRLSAHFHTVSGVVVLGTAAQLYSPAPHRLRCGSRPRSSGAPCEKGGGG